MALTAVALLWLATSACTTDGKAAPEKEFCDVPTSSAEGKLVRDQLKAQNLRSTVFAETSDLVEGMQERLEEDLSEPTLPQATCSYAPRDTAGTKTLRIEFSWVPRNVEAGHGNKLPGPLSHYNVNGAVGEANDISSHLRVECVLPGADKKTSKQILLQGEASNTLLMGTEVQQKTIDQQVTFLYLMTRRATEALGCENDPLAKEPVVKASAAPAV
ncbi:hypothetical protein [Streptomyces sp. B1I3]|uniref:hypothetical protein n=1 Tax=Streptomyces sp. B1I3 TaxID=3042264 RepID=UPI00277F9770|nr:hypothetical protein [Streptomyces sp. B1I3]MDQ0797219.1 hypothetical protein [Streptomyces sp. B1I3]